LESPSTAVSTGPPTFTRLINVISLQIDEIRGAVILMGGEQATALRIDAQKSNLPFELGISIDAAGVSCNACPAAATLAARTATGKP